MLLANVYFRIFTAKHFFFLSLGGYTFLIFVANIYMQYDDSKINRQMGFRQIEADEKYLLQEICSPLRFRYLELE